MLTRLSLGLLRSASGRNLAIDLVARHGAVALDVVTAELIAVDRASEAYRVLTVARREVVRLMPSLAGER